MQSVNISPIPKLYRHVDNFDAAVAHLEGQLWFKRLHHFRSLEGDVREDKQEGRASGQIDGGLHVSVANDEFPTQPVYILCFSENKSGAYFGDYAMELVEPDALAQRVKAALPKSASATWHKVIYSDDTGYAKDPGPIEIVERAECTKPVRFAPEREWRLIIRLAPDLKITNECLQLDVGDLDQILHISGTLPQPSSYDPDGLKPLANLLDRDERNGTLVRSPSGQPLSKRDFYEAIGRYELASNVPKDVRVQFDLARNLFVYSWFVYRFSSPAQAQAYAALERALKCKLADAQIGFPKRATLSRLLEKIISLGWLRDSDFPHLFDTRRSQDTEGIGIERVQYDPDGADFVSKLPKILPQLRNSYVHGDATIVGPITGFMALDAATNIINALYREGSDPASG